MLAGNIGRPVIPAGVQDIMFADAPNHECTIAMGLVSVFNAEQFARVHARSRSAKVLFLS
jgi:hypothetical protein